eukprot:s578_g10.t1
MLFLVTRPRPAAMLERSFVQLSWLAVCVLPLPKTQAPKSTFAWDQFASTVTVAIITIFCWEAAKYLYRRADLSSAAAAAAWCRLREAYLVSIGEFGRNLGLARRRLNSLEARA